MKKAWKIGAAVAAVALIATVAAVSILRSLSADSIDKETTLLEAEGGTRDVLDLLPAPLGRKPGDQVVLLQASRFKWPYPNAGQPAQQAVSLSDKKIPEAARLRKAYDEYSSWLPTAFGPTRSVSPPGSTTGEPPKWNDGWLPLLATLAANNKDFLEFVRDVADGPPAMFDTDWTKGAATLLPQLSYLRGTARLVSADAAARLNCGDTAGALADAQAILRLRSFIDDEPTAISKNVAIAIDTIGFSTLMRVLREGRPDRARLETILADLDGREKRNRLTGVLLGETAMAFDTFQMARKDSGVMQSIAIGQYPLGGEPLPKKASRYLHWVAWNSKADQLRYLKTMREVRAHSRMDYPSILNGLPPRTPTVGWGSAAPSLSWTLTPIMTSWLPNEFWTQARADACVRMTRTVLALYFHHMDAGAYPASLDALVPKYLKEPQIDPYDGKPLKYRQTERGYVLYSVGEDRKDNSGDPAADIVLQTL